MNILYVIIYYGGHIKNYLPRLIENTIAKQMKAIGAILIEGPKWCGKSTTAERYSKTTIKLQNPIIYKQYQAFASTSKELLLSGEKPKMFDEWQKIPDIWDFIRADIDESSGVGQYILTGSAKPIDDGNRHSGIGRIAKITMRPMSLWESQDSTGEVSLTDLFDGNDNIKGHSTLSLNDLAFVICRGGWPESVVRPNHAVTLALDYYNSLITNDIVSVDGIKRTPRRAATILRSYARNISTLATTAKLLSDISANDMTMDIKTLSAYLAVFSNLFIIDDITAWSPKLRSKTVVRLSPKRQFVDPSIAAVALGATPNDLINDLNSFGFLFESLCERDLRIYADSINGEVYHYHDAAGLEADSIIRLRDGRWGAVEIKLCGNEIDTAAANLLSLKNKIDNDKLKPPSFLMILTGVQNAYKRPDGVLVVPIGCLKN